MSDVSALQLTLFSFGYKYGVPVHSNFLLDVRCLPNPYWDDKLRSYTGLVAEVADYVLDSKMGEEMMHQLKPLLLLWCRQQAQAKKKELHIAIGCTGGRHRSVAMVENMAIFFREKGFVVNHFHRDIAKDGE